jgi:Skp family chaperone for outer membrane proteins
VAASAQQTSTGPAQAGAPAGPVKGKIAIINMANVEQQIGDFKIKYDELNRKFEPRVKEVQAKADRINALETTIKTQRDTLTPARIAEMTEQLERMKREYQREAEDLQAEGERDKNRALGPLYEKITRFGRDYTAKRGITVLIDIANALNSGTVLWFDPRADITADFVAEYNRANPTPNAPAATQPAAPAPGVKKP